MRHSHIIQLIGWDGRNLFKHCNIWSCGLLPSQPRHRFKQISMNFPTTLALKAASRETNDIEWHVDSILYDFNLHGIRYHSAVIWYLYVFVIRPAFCFICCNLFHMFRKHDAAALGPRASHTSHVIIIKAKDAEGIVSPEESLAQKQVFHNSELNQCISWYIMSICISMSCLNLAKDVKIG